MKSQIFFAVALSVAAAGFGTVYSSSADTLPENASPIYGVTLPDGYRDWTFIAPAQEAPPAVPTRRTAGSEFSFDDEPAPLPAPQPAAPPISAAPPAPVMQSTPAAPPKPAPAPANAATPQRAPSASEQDRYFAYIPAEVTSDRAKRRSRALNLALIVLLLANIAAAAALVSAL